MNDFSSTEPCPADFPAFMLMAEFARFRGVSRTTVLKWRDRGHLAMTSAGLVDVVQSERSLDTRPDRMRGGVVTRRAAVTGPVTIRAGNKPPLLSLLQRVEALEKHAFGRTRPTGDPISERKEP